jgi:hypothetical protein
LLLGPKMTYEKFLEWSKRRWFYLLREMMCRL